MGRATRKNSITSPELLERVNPANLQLMNEYLDYLQSVNRSEGTRFSYRNDLEIAFVWCLQNNDNKFFVDWTKRNVVAFQNWMLNENGNSPARVRRIKATLSSLSNFIETVLDDEYPGFRNIIRKIESPVNTPVRDKTVFTDEELEELLDKLTEKGNYRLACFLALAMYGGRRKAELCRFKVSDFADDRLVCDGALYKSAPIRTKGRGNQGKMLECYTLAKKFKPYLDAWMKQREENGIESEWLFPSDTSESGHIETPTVNGWAETLSRMSGKNFYWHAVRHFNISALSRAGIPDGVIVDMIGWTSSEMFKVYNDNPKDDQIGMYFKDGDISVRPARSLDEI